MDKLSKKLQSISCWIWTAAECKTFIKLYMIKNVVGEYLNVPININRQKQKDTYKKKVKNKLYKIFKAR